MIQPVPAQQLLLATVVITAGIYDIRYRRIPNWLVLAGLLLGIAFNGFFHQLPGLKQAGLGLGLGFLVYLPLYLLRGMGAGDVKLMAAVGAIVGPGNWFIIFILSGLLGGLFAILLILYQRRFRKTLQNLGTIANAAVHLQAPHTMAPELDVRSSKGLSLPHGAVIALAALGFLGLLAVWTPT